MIIAEIGLNHKGSYDRAKRYIEYLCKTHVDAITLQVREPSFYKDIYKEYALTDLHYKDLIDQVKKNKKEIGFAIADVNKVRFFDSLGADFFKVIRKDLENEQIMEELVLTKKELIISTGLSSDDEIDRFLKLYKKNDNIVLNHTQLSYEVEDCNLRAIDGMRERYDVPISFGSHCSNENVLYMSLCFKPEHILFYVKDERFEEFPDDKHAILLSDVKEISHNLKKLSSALGDGNKTEFYNKMERR
ncbi:MAG: N-acetylneuraminate synthase family protein [Candidatus Hodarchaeales archaeon]|jgi:sialic acid synthase SpsE